MTICLLVDNGSKSSTNLAQTLKSLDTSLEIRRYDEVTSLDKYSAVILSGRSASNRKSIVDNSRIIEQAKNNDIPLLGICFGCEVLAVTFGATLRRLPSFRRGFRIIEVIRKNDLIRGPKLRVFESHGLEIARLPRQLESLARSSVTQNEVIRHRESRLYGLQFHPERSGVRGRHMMENFLSICRTA